MVELIPLHEQFENHDEFRPDSTAALSGLEIALHLAAGPVVSVTFSSASRLRWQADAEAAPLPATSGDADYEAVEVRPQIFAIVTSWLEDRTSAITVLDFEQRRAVINVTRLLDGADGVTEQTRIIQAGVGQPLREPAPLTSELVGKRVHHRYSTTHAFEHIYLSETMYAFHGIAGPERGLAEVSPADTHKIADELYLFSWHELSQPFNGAIVLDLRAGRATGRLFGWDAQLRRALQIRTGSVATLLSETSYDGL